MTVYFFYGEEDFNIDLEIAEMQSKLNQDFLAMNYQILDNPDFTTLIQALRTTPMMFGDMLIVIQCEKYLTAQKNFFEDNELEEIENALTYVNESLNIVFVAKLPRDDGKKFDSRRKLFKILSKHNTKEFQTYKSYKTTEIKNWIIKQAKKKDLTLKDDALDLLIEQIGNNLRQFDAELDKLKLIAHPEKIITKNMISEVTISNQDLFNITELIMLNKKDKALLEFKKLTDKKHPLEILAAIQTMLRKWIILKTKSTTCSNMELSKLTGMPDFIVKQTLTKLKNTSTSDLVRLKENLFNAECKIKAAESLDITMEVEIALIR